jgi:hypothetical protein
MTLSAPGAMRPIDSQLQYLVISSASAPSTGVRLGTASHATDEFVSGDAVAQTELRRALELDRVGQRPIDRLSRLEIPRPPKFFNDLSLRD